MPQPAANEAVLFGGDEAWCWKRGIYDIWVLRGRCYVQQGAAAAEAQQAVLWVSRNADQYRSAALANLPESPQSGVTVIAYLEGDVRIADARSGGSYQLRDRSWFGEFMSEVEPQTRTPPPQGEPTTLPQVFVNAQARRDARLAPAVRQVQFTTPAGPVAGQMGLPGQFATPPVVEMPSNPQPYAVMQPGVPVQPGNVAPPTNTNPAGPVAAGPMQPVGRRLRAFSRSSVKVQVKWIPNPNNPQEWVGVISPGVNLIIDGLDGFGQLDISTDRMVIWTTGMQEPDLSGARAQEVERPMELYLEGNIVFREGDRVIYAERMFYNVNQRTGTILNAEVTTPVSDYHGMARLKADVVRQLGMNNFQADNARLTTSRMTNPRYRLQASSLSFTDNQRPIIDPVTRQPLIDPTTGEPAVQHDRLAVSTGNTLFVGPVPVFYWPRMATNLENPSFYVRNVKINSDRIFGQQIRADLDMYQIFGVQNPPDGHDWIGSVDYFSDRGPAAGTTYTYSGDNFLGFGPGTHRGIFDAWAIQDDGLDVLGSDRRDLEPEHHFRHRLFGRHRQELPENIQLSAELGWISDRNFLEQYYELEYDTFKDQSTGFELKQYIDNTSWALSADLRLNQFFTQTEQLPRLDYYRIGDNILWDWLTWSQHSSAEYAKLRTASYPRNPQDQAKFTMLPWEATVSGERLVTSQELAMPLNLGPAKVTPYVLGQAGHWGEALDGDQLNRLYGQAGVCAALPFFSVNPDVQSELFNLNGLAHKVVFDVDASFAEANQNLTDFAFYDQLNDDAQEQFRRRMTFNTFNGAIPGQFDDRFYALRSGLAGNVTSPSAELADDLTAVRMGLRQRWQTKRGSPQKPRIVDWIVFDTEAVFFPRADRDNFGQNFGLARYDFRWHLGDRFTLLSDGQADFFDNAGQTVSVGATLNRPTNGSFYIGYRAYSGPQLAGALTPFYGQVLTTSASYRFGPKWFGTASLSYDFSGNGTIGNSFSLVRVGESFLVGFNFLYDAYKENVTGMLVVEPRFLPGIARSAMGGAALIPPVGVYGLE
ncbi:MAG: hypothetical protein QM775_29280 [Pirellulales bacterium]